MMTICCHTPAAPASCLSTTKPVSLLELSCQLKLTCVASVGLARRLLGAAGGTITGATLVPLNQLKFPTLPVGAASIPSRSTCCPAESTTPLCVIVFQLCHPPVSGMAI